MTKTRKFKHRFVCVTETTGILGTEYVYWSAPTRLAAQDRAYAVNKRRDWGRRAYALDSRQWDIGVDNIILRRAA